MLTIRIATPLGVTGHTGHQSFGHPGTKHHIQKTSAAAQRISNSQSTSAVDAPEATANRLASSTKDL